MKINHHPCSQIPAYYVELPINVNVDVWGLWEETGTPADNPQRCWLGEQNESNLKHYGTFVCYTTESTQWSCCGARKSLDVTSQYKICITEITFFFFLKLFSKLFLHWLKLETSRRLRDLKQLLLWIALSLNYIRSSLFLNSRMYQEQKQYQSSVINISPLMGKHRFR